jgi:hypothetical protein
MTKEPKVTKVYESNMRKMLVKTYVRGKIIYTG